MADSQRKTANLLNISQPITSAGNRYIYNGDFAFNGDAVTFKANFYCSLAMVDNNDTEIVNRALTANTALTVSIPNGIKSLRIYTPNAITEGYVMINAGSTALPYEPYGWVHSLRKLCSATETIQSGDTIYANGQPITTYNIKGNTVQSGTPSSQNPVMPNGCGERTSNLFNAYNTWTKRTGADVIDIQDNGATISITTTLFCYTSVDVTANTDYILTCTSSGGIARNIAIYKSTSFTTENLIASLGATGDTFNSGTNTKLYILFYASNNSQSATAIYNDVRMNIGSTSQPFEPYGFTIPISSGGVTTNLYTIEPLMKISDSVDSKSNMTETRNIVRQRITQASSVNQFSRGFTVDVPIAAKYQAIYSNVAVNTDALPEAAERDGKVWINAAKEFIGFGASEQFPIVYSGNPSQSEIDVFNNYLQNNEVYVWYVLATPTTETVTAPSIPTTDGANSIIIDTTVQPSEFSATWTGWHDSSVKEYDGTDWQ